MPAPYSVILNTIMVLFKYRTLIAAIFISILWHFLCIFLFNPALPTGNIREHNTSIAFLGGILENVIAGNEEPFKPSRVSPEHVMDKTNPVETGFINTRQEKKDFTYSIADNSGLLKLGAYRKKDITRVNFSDFFIKGDARDRIIMHKPDLEKVVMLPSDFNSDFSASVRFRISKDGFVKYVECVASSGFSEIDRAAVRYVRKWQFMPDSEDNQEGVVRVSFK